jgi:3-methyladenine DNA glycosylase AlkD
MTLAEVRAELEAMADPKTLAVNERHGDRHAVKLGDLRALAKRLKTQHELALELWETDDAAARLLTTLICRPKAFTRDELDRMIRQTRTRKVHAWLADADPIVASAGWTLTSKAVVKTPEVLDLAGLLDTIESQMKDAPDRLQWEMNTCLAQIGITHPEHRDRAVAIGERLEVLKDYPTPPNCTSPFAPTWIAEMVSRQSAS